MLLLNRIERTILDGDDSVKVSGKQANLISKLTPEMVEQLSKFNLPNIDEGERLLKEATITFPTFGIPVNAISGTLFIEAALLLLSAYFWIWYREARLSPTFPATGTVFGALARSKSSRLMF
jgi:hypothetical protein